MSRITGVISLYSNGWFIFFCPLRWIYIGNSSSLLPRYITHGKQKSSILRGMSSFWSNYGDLTRPKTSREMGPLISGKSRLVKYNLARSLVFEEVQVDQTNCPVGSGIRMIHGSSKDRPATNCLGDFLDFQGLIKNPNITWNPPPQKKKTQCVYPVIFEDSRGFTFVLKSICTP